MHRSHIEYIIRKLHFYKTGRKDDSPPFQRTGEWYLTSCVLSRWNHEPKYGGHIPMDVKPSMGVKEQEGVSVVHCFSCKTTTGLMGLVQEFGAHAIPEGLMTTAEYDDLLAYIELAEEDDTLTINRIDKREDEPVPPDMLECLGGLTNPVGIAYAKERRLTGEDVELWQIGYHERTNRLMFPLITYSRKIPMVQGRILLPDDEIERIKAPKYKNFPNIEKQQYLYGEHLVTDETEVLVVVEGILDAITLNREFRTAGMSPQYIAVGVMGSELGDHQLQKLVAWGNEVVAFGDNDNAGKLLNKQIVEKLKNYVGVSTVEYPDYGNSKLDPDKLGAQAVKMVEKRTYWLQIKLGHLFRKAGLSDGKA